MTSLLITKNGKLFVYWSELRIGNDLSQWLSSCEQNGDFAEVAEGEVEKIIRYTTKTLQNPIVENETMIIPNDCYEVGELICATCKCTTDFGCDLKKCQWQSFAYFKEPKREQEDIDAIRECYEYDPKYELMGQLKELKSAIKDCLPLIESGAWRERVNDPLADKKVARLKEILNK